MNDNQLNPGALIIDGHGRADLGVVRALGERGVPIYLLTNDPASPVAASRYVTRVLPYPPRDASDDERLRALIEIGRQFRYPPVFFSTGDSSLMLFSRHRRLLEKYYRHHIGEPRLVEAMYDKVLFASLAAAYGLDVPFSATPRSLSDLKDVIDRFTFPVMVKAAEKRRWDEHPEMYELTGGNLKGVRLETKEELLAFYRAASRYDRRMVIQDYIDGRDEELWSFHGFIGRDGDLLAGFTGQKVRTYPIHRGIGCFVVSKYEPAVAEAGIRALTTLGYTGHASVQMKRVPGTNRFRIFEINCRYSSWNGLHAPAGVNMAYAAYLDSLERTQAPLPRQRDGKRWIDARKDVRALQSYRSIGEWGIADWLGSYHGSNCYAYFAWNDPLPALVYYAPLLRRIAGYPFRMLLRRLGVRVARPVEN